MNTEVTNDQIDEIRVLSWNINGLGNKMADPDFLTCIREYDMIFLTATMKGNYNTLVLPGYPGISSIMCVEHINIKMLQELLVVLEY